MNKLIIGIDFDGTCVTHEYPRVGSDVGAVPTLKALTDAGHRLILWTMRSGQYLEDARQWFADNDIPLYAANENPEQHEWTSSPKVYAQLYIDDAAFGCPLIYEPGVRPYVDWTAVHIELARRGLIGQ